MIDTVVLGLGAVGSFALRAVARDGEGSVLGIERFTRGHAKGSSHGKSRVYRRAYFEHSNYVPWCKFSVREFIKLQEEQATPIIQQCGVLMAVPEDNAKLLEAAVASAKEHNIEIEELSTEELRARYPQFNFADNALGIYEPGGGFVRPEAAVVAALKDAERHGATIREETIVKSIKEVRDDDGAVSFVEITTESKQGAKELIQAKTVLVAAGAWTAELLPSYAKCLTVTRQLQAWVDTSSTTNPRLYNSSTMPAAVLVLNDLPTPLVYTLPADSNASDQDDAYRNCVKMGIHCRNYKIDPNVNHALSVTPEEEDEMRTAIRAGFCEDVSSQSVLEIRACMYTMTEDEHFVIGPPQDHHRICAVAGLSGHGFKMAPALGQMLADFASGKGLASWNADFCSPSRYGV